VAAVLVLLIGSFAVLIASRGLSRQVARLVALCYVAHLLGAAAQVWMHTDYYGGGDMLTYMRNAQPIVRLLQSDIARWFPEWLRLVVHLDNDLPFVHGTGGTSGTMVALGAASVYVFDKPLPLWEVCLLTGATSTLGQIWICKAAISVFEEHWHKSIALGVLLVPSVVFWSSALMKEAIALPFLGILLAATVALAQKRWARGILGVVVGGIGVGLVKGYLLMPFVIAVAAAAYVGKNAGAKEKRKLGLPYALAAAAIAVVGLAGISAAFPQYSPGQIAESTARYQATYETLENIGQGGSNVDLGDDVADVSLLGQLKRVPLATVNALFRPMFFEARSIVQLAASLETLAVVVLLLRLMRFGPGKSFSAVTNSPALTFCAVFALTFGIAVGLTTLNLGTLSRYRIPMMPFVTVLLFVLGQQAKTVTGAAVQIPGRAAIRLAAARNRERILAERRRA
jgi:hypothetical protein